MRQGRTTLLRKGEARRSVRSARHAVDSLKEAAARRDPADGAKSEFTFAGKQNGTLTLYTHRHLKSSEHGSLRNIQVRPHPFSCDKWLCHAVRQCRTTLLRKCEARRSVRSARHAVDSLKEAAARRDPADGDKSDFTFVGKLSATLIFTGDRHLKCSEHGSFRNISNAFWNPVRSTQITRGCTEGRCQPISAFSICSQTKKEIYTVCTCMSTGSVAVATLYNFL